MSWFACVQRELRADPWINGLAFFGLSLAAILAFFFFIVCPVFILRDMMREKQHADDPIVSCYVVRPEQGDRSVVQVWGYRPNALPRLLFSDEATDLKDVRASARAAGCPRITNLPGDNICEVPR